MGKRTADKQLTQLNQFDYEEDSSGYGEGEFRKANQNEISRRVIKKPKSRLRGPAVASAVAAFSQSISNSSNNDGSTATTKPAFHGFANFGSAANTTVASTASAKPSTPFGSFSGFGTAATPSATIAATSSSNADDPPAKKPAFQGFAFGAQSTSSISTVTPEESSDSSDKPTTGFSFGAGTFKASSAFGSQKTATENDGDSAGESEQKSKGNLFSGVTFGKNAAQSKPAEQMQNPPQKQPSITFGSFSNPASLPPQKESTSDAAGIEQKETTAQPAPFSMSMFKPPTSTPSLSATASTEKKEASEKQQKQPAAFKMSMFTPPTSATSTSATSTSTTTKPTNAFTSSKPIFSSGFVPPVNSSLPKAAQSNDSNSRLEHGLDYYMDLRGLNVSLKDKITEAISADAFVDLTCMLEQYRSHRQKITNAKPTSTTTASDNHSEKPSLSTTKPTEKTTIAASTTNAGSGGLTEEAKVSKPLFSFGNLEKKQSTPFAAPSTASPAKANGSGFSFNFAKSTPNPGSESSVPAAKPMFSFGFGKPASGGADNDDNTDNKQKPVFSFGFGNTTANTTEGRPGVSPAKDTDSHDAVDTKDGEADEEDNTDSKQPTNAGEENETTVFETRSKVYMWDGKDKKYKDLGIGNLKVNTWELDDGKKRARILCRQEGSDKLTLNASLFKEMTCEYTKGKKEVGFLVIKDSKPTRFLIRIKFPDMAAKLYEAIEKAKASI